MILKTVLKDKNKHLYVCVCVSVCVLVRVCVCVNSGNKLQDEEKISIPIVLLNIFDLYM